MAPAPKLTPSVWTWISERRKELEERASALRDDLAAVETELAELAATEKTLSRMSKGARPGKASPPPDTNELAVFSGFSNVVPWSQMTRTDAVVEALKQIGRPAHLEELTKFLQQHGRPDDTERLVSAALAHVKARNGDVWQENRGWWEYRPFDPYQPGEDEPDDGAPPGWLTDMNKTLAHVVKASPPGGDDG